MTDVRVFAMRLKAGALDEYKRHHAAVWPELQDEIRSSGIVRMRIYESDPLLVVFSEINRPDAWELLWTSEVLERWGTVMEPLLEFGRDGLIASTEMNEIYYFESALTTA